MTEKRNLCPCCSGILYENCCKPFHEGKLPSTALQLMRSRYSAYALNIPNYIVATTHPGSPQYKENQFLWKRSISQFSKHSTFHRLEVLDHKEKSNVATVVFTVYLSQNDEDATFTEKSYFEKINERWFYRSGTFEKGEAFTLVETGPFNILPIAYYGEAVLRRKADPITEITPEILQFVEEMIATMDSCAGIGLAAPQVHRSVRIFMIRPLLVKGEDKYARDDGVSDEVKVFINPIITSSSAETWIAPEGCLSIPTIYAPVQRPKEITVSYTFPDGNSTTQSFAGWEARQIMHENDHIEGILIPDRLSQKELGKVASSLEKLEKRLRLS